MLTLCRLVVWVWALVAWAKSAGEDTFDEMASLTLLVAPEGSDTSAPGTAAWRPTGR